MKYSLTLRKYNLRCKSKIEKMISRKFQVLTTVWYVRKFSPTLKIFRQIDLQCNSLVKKLL